MSDFRARGMGWTLGETRRFDARSTEASQRPVYLLWGTRRRFPALTSSAQKSPNAARLLQAAEASTWLKTSDHLKGAGAARSAHQMGTVVDYH